MVMDALSALPLMLLQLAASVVLALPVAWNREREGPTMGLRTFPLVAMGSCAYALVGLSLVGPDNPEPLMRIMQGLIGGIGFVGGGAILKDTDTVRGTASAASIWVTGALGAAVGFQQWSLAIALSVANFTVIVVMSKIKGTSD